MSKLKLYGGHTSIQKFLVQAKDSHFLLPAIRVIELGSRSQFSTNTRDILRDFVETLSQRADTFQRLQTLILPENFDVEPLLPYVEKIEKPNGECDLLSPMDFYGDFWFTGPDADEGFGQDEDEEDWGDWDDHYVEYGSDSDDDSWFM